MPRQYLGSLLLGSRPSWVSVCQVYVVSGPRRQRARLAHLGPARLDPKAAWLDRPWGERHGLTCPTCACG